jgi:hypothetical protein
MIRHESRTREGRKRQNRRWETHRRFVA